MAGTNIDNLNFKVILDDEKFDEKINRDIELAKQLNVQLSALLNVKSRVSNTKMVGDATKAAKFQKATADAAAAQERLKTASTNTAAAQERLAAATANAANAQERLKQSQMRTEQLAKRITAQTERQNKAYAQQSRILNELKGLALGYLSIHGASQLLSSLVRVTGEFELQKTTLAAMLGDLNAAEGVITRIQGLAVESPFQFKELTTYAKQLSAFSVPAQELYDTTKMLADISAGLGVGMDRIVLAYGQVRSAAFLRGQEVRQFTEAGIPILDELAKQFSELEGRAVSTGEVFDKISARLVPFEMVAKVFKDMTSEGGKFYNMQEVQAETLRGKISNLKDAYEVMLNEIGKGQSENLKGAVDWARRLMQNYEETGKVLAELVVTYGVYKAALLTLTIVTNNFALANSKLYTSLINATKWAINNPYVILAAGITAAGYAIYKNITALEGYEKVHKSFVETEEKYNASLSAEGVKLDALYAKLRLAKEGTEEYEKAKKQIYTQYAGYISDLKEEGVEVGNLATLYDSLKIKVEEYTKAKFRSLAQSDLDQTFEQEVSVVRDRYKTLVSEIESIRKNAGEEPLSAMDKEGLWQYITGDIATLWDMAENPDLKRIKRVLASKILPFGDIAKEIQGDLRKIKSTYASDMQAIINLYGETSDELAENDPFKVPLGGEGEGGKSPAQKAIEEQIRSVQKLQDAYEKLMPYLNEVQMKSTLKSLFPNISEGVIDSLDFNAELERLADELEKFDEDAAQRLRDTIGKDVAGTIAESFRAMEQYKKMLDSWLGEDFELSGSGVSFDISKIIRNLNSEYAKIDQKRAKALDMLNKAQMGDEVALAKVREVYGEEVWQKYITEGKAAIDELARIEKEGAKKTAEEKARDAATKYLKELYTTQNIDLTDFGDKNLKQVGTLLERLKSIRDGIATEVMFTFPKSEEEFLRLETLKEVLKQLGVVIEDTGEEYDKKFISRLKNSIGKISSLAGKIGELGEAMGNIKIASAANAIKSVGDVISSTLEGFESGGAAGAIIAGVESIAAKLIDATVAAEQLRHELALTAIEYEDALARIEYENIQESFDGIFGSDELAKFEANITAVKDSLEELSDAQNLISEMEKFWGGANLTSDMRTGWQQFWGQDKNQFSFNLSTLFDDSGKPIEESFEKLQAYYDAYGEGLSDSNKELVTKLLTEWQRYEDGMTASTDYIKSIFSEAADTIANDMVNAFIESGDAAIDMKSIVSDAASKMASDLIKTLYIMPELNKYAEDLQAIADDSSLTADEKTEKSLGFLAVAVSEIEDNKDAINETLGKLEEYFQNPEEGTNALGEGIKGITEDQANLLASYLNAIRADVSFSKTLWVKMDANLQRIADMFTSSPTLMEYQAQIAANTYNTATATQEILSQIRGIVTNDAGDASIRVYTMN